MPVTPTYDWSETVDEVTIRVRLPGITRRKADIFATEVLVKVVAHPYVLLLDLHAEIDADAGAAFSMPGEVLFRLPKKERRAWTKLVYSGSKLACEARRKSSIDRAYQVIEQRRRQHIERLKHEKKVSTDRQIEVDRRKRQAIEVAKASELEAEVVDLNKWTSALPSEVGNQQDHSDTSDDSESMCDSRSGRQPVQPVQNKGNDGTDSHTRSNALHLESGHTIGDRALWHKPATRKCSGTSSRPIPLTPPPRETLDPVGIDFTRLEFPHLPARQQREEELRLYKKAQADAMESVNAAEIADQQPAFLKDKADALFAQRNYHAALNAYTSALEREEDDSQLALACKMNRAACYTRLGCLAECIADCDHVIKVIDAGEAANTDHHWTNRFTAMHVKALTRRSAAHASSGNMKKAYLDCTTALNMDPTNTQLLALLGELKMPGVEESAEHIQQRAHARFASGQYRAAAEAFSALGVLYKSTPIKLASALSNQAMCMLCMHQFDKALEACQAALVCATGWSSLPEKPTATVLGLLRDTLSTEDAPQVMMKCVGRMAACLAHMQDYSEAERMYRLAGGIAQGQGNDAAAQVFVADAQHMRSLAASRIHSVVPCSKDNSTVPVPT